jgi:hypothetical protein
VPCLARVVVIVRKRGKGAKMKIRSLVGKIGVIGVLLLVPGLLKAENSGPSWTSCYLNAAQVGQSYSQSILPCVLGAPSGTGVEFSVVSGAPQWLSLSSSGVVSGVPTQSDVTTVDFVASFTTVVNGQSYSANSHVEFGVFSGTILAVDCSSAKVQRSDGSVFNNVNWGQYRVLGPNLGSTAGAYGSLISCSAGNFVGTNYFNQGAPVPGSDCTQQKMLSDTAGLGAVSVFGGNAFVGNGLNGYPQGQNEVGVGVLQTTQSQGPADILSIGFPPNSTSGTWFESYTAFSGVDGQAFSGTIECKPLPLAN